MYKSIYRMYLSVKSGYQSPEKEANISFEMNSDLERGIHTQEVYQLVPQNTGQSPTEMYTW